MAASRKTGHGTAVTRGTKADQPMPDGLAPPQFPLHVLSEYALLADGERGILVGPRGDFVWMCAPRWDSDAVFSSLIGGKGVYA